MSGVLSLGLLSVPVSCGVVNVTANMSACDRFTLPRMINNRRSSAYEQLMYGDTGAAADRTTGRQDRMQT